MDWKTRWPPTWISKHACSSGIGTGLAKTTMCRAGTPQRIYADFILTLRSDEPDTDDEFHQVFVVETKGLHLKHSSDTAYKRSVFDTCSRHARKADWAELVPAMRNKAMRFEVVDEGE